MSFLYWSDIIIRFWFIIFGLILFIIVSFRRWELTSVFQNRNRSLLLIVRRRLILGLLICKGGNLKVNLFWLIWHRTVWIRRLFLCEIIALYRRFLLILKSPTFYLFYLILRWYWLTFPLILRLRPLIIKLINLSLRWLKPCCVPFIIHRGCSCHLFLVINRDFPLRFQFFLRLSRGSSPCVTTPMIVGCIFWVLIILKLISTPCIIYFWRTDFCSLICIGKSIKVIRWNGCWSLSRLLGSRYLWDGRFFFLFKHFGVQFRIPSFGNR